MFSAVHILDFLIQRLADSAHSSELLVSAVHRLVSDKFLLF